MLRFLFMVMMIVSSCVIAQTDEERGLELARKADERSRGFGDSQATMKMILVSNRGEQSVRELRMMTLEMQDEDNDDRSLLIFDKPLDVRGSALLTWSHRNRDDDQWLYFPALRSVRTIASRKKSGPFMGSEFSFEDMSAPTLEKYDYRYIRDEACGHLNLNCHVIERTPLDSNSGYTRQIVWMDELEYRTWKVDYYDRKKSHQKTLTVSGFNLYEDRFWRASRMEMVNHQTGRSTILEWSDYAFDTGLSETDFTQNSLMRIR